MTGASSSVGLGGLHRLRRSLAIPLVAAVLAPLLTVPGELLAAPPTPPRPAAGATDPTPRPEQAPPTAAPPAAAVVNTLPPATIETIDDFGGPFRPGANALATGDPWLLLDGDASTGVGGQRGDVRRFRVSFDRTRRLTGLLVHGNSQGSLTVALENPGPGSADRLTPIPGLTGLSNLAAPVKAQAGWSQFWASETVESRSVVLEWRPATPMARLAEVAFFGLSDRPAARSEPLADALFEGVPPSALALSASPDAQAISAPDRASSADAGSFRFTLARDPRGLDRAFLVYELEGLAHWSAAPRRINGHPARGGEAGERSGRAGNGGLQVEEIAPQWLRRGENEIRFEPRGADDPVGYRVRRLRLVALPRSAPPVRMAINGTPASALQDDQPGTGVTAARGSQIVDVAFATRSQPLAVSLLIGQAMTGTLEIRGVRGGKIGRPVLAPVSLDTLAPGWHHLSLDAQAAVDGLRLGWRVGQAGGEASGRLSELHVSALPPPGAAATPRLTLSHPLHGECQAGLVQLRGFFAPLANPAGVGRLEVDGRPVDGQLGIDGGFSFTTPVRRAGGPSTVRLSLRYPDGTRLTRTVSLGPCTAPAAVATSTFTPPVVEDAGAPFGAWVQAGKAQTLSFGGARLEIPADALTKDTRITIRPLLPGQVPAMDAGMENVGTARQGFRLGPHGLRFKAPIKVVFPYDADRAAERSRTRLGTFYYDEHERRWRPVVRLALADGDAAGQRRMISATDHFTDFVTATLEMPEHPAPDLFKSSSLQDLKVGDPGAGLTLIEPPVGSTSGAAQLTYSLDLPPGRNENGPNLAVTYNSESRGTWLGTGWDLQASQIEVDTRFGVPRYTGDESYLLDGARLTPVDPATSNPRRYVRRIEGSFERILRHGTGPGEYHFEVTSKDGTTFTYGQSAAARLASYRVDVSGRSGNIFRWHLERVVDPFGNRTSYSYQADDGNNGEPFVQRYLARIDYSAHDATALRPHYHVDFVLEDLLDTQGQPRRRDVVVDGRAGFQVLTRRRLQRVDVRFHEEIIRRYSFEYRTGEFGKTVLAAIAVKGFGGEAEFYRHSFDYHQLPRDEVFGPQLFTTRTTWGPVFQAGGGRRNQDGLSHTDQAAGGGDLKVGIGISGLFSLTAEGGLHSSDDATRLKLFDLNGDGMPDLLDDGGGLSANFLRLPLSNHFRVVSPAPVVGHPRLGHTSERGWSAGGGLDIDALNARAAASYTRSESRDDRAVLDMNGDGFPDLVASDNGRVLVNVGDRRGNFSSTGRNWGQLADAPSSNPDRDAQGRTSAFRPADMLMRWSAPFTGNVRLRGDIRRKLPGGTRGDDGLVVSIYRNGDPGPIWERFFAPGDMAVCVPALGNGCGDAAGLPLGTVTGGERFYMKVHARDNPANDQLLWDPTFVYVDQPQELLEPHGAPIFSFSQQRDFRLAGPASVAWVSPARGDVVVDGGITKAPTSDDVTVSIEAVSPRGRAVVFTRTLLAAEVFTAAAPLPITLPAAACSFDSTPASRVCVEEGDELQFRVTAQTAIDPNLVGWTPVVRFNQLCRKQPRTDVEFCGAVSCLPTAAGETICSIANDPIPQAPIPSFGLIQPAQVFYSAPQFLPLEPTQTLRAAATGPARFAGILMTSGPATVLVQGVNRLLFKQSFDAPGALLDFSAELTTDEQLFATVLTAAGTMASLSLAVEGRAMPVNHRSLDPSFVVDPRAPGDPNALVHPMSGGYHRWFVGEWSAVDFNESLIRIPPENAPAPPFMFMAPMRQGTDSFPGPQWVGRSDGYIAAGEVFPSRLGNSRGLDSLRVGSTWNFDMAVGVAVVGVGANLGDTTARRDLFDLNGDGFADVITQPEVLLSNGSGFAESLPASLPLPIRETSHRTVRITASGDTGKLINFKDRVITTAFNLGLTYGKSATQIDFADVNADGLPDQVLQRPDSQGRLTVRLNLGYGFTAPINWAAAGWQQTDLGFREKAVHFISAFGDAVRPDVVRLQDIGSNAVSGGAALGTTGLSGGIGVNSSMNRTMVDLVDVTGDGLPDQVMKRPNEGLIRVKTNLGDRFAAEQTYPMPGWGADLDNQLTPIDFRFYGNESDPDTLGFNRNINVQGSLGFKICIILCFGSSVFYTRGSGNSLLTFDDVDGDGTQDHVLKLDGDANVYARLNLSAKANLLRSVSRPMGGSFTLDYERAGNSVQYGAEAKPLVDMQRNQWVLARVELTDGQGTPPLVTRFNYDVDVGEPEFPNVVSSGFFDRDEREHLGYARVKTTRPDDSVVEEHFHNRDFYLKGLRHHQEERDAAGNIYRALDVDYEKPFGVPLLTGSFFPKEKTRINSIHEETGEAVLRTAKVATVTETRTFDDVGNLTKLIDEAEADDAADDVTYTITYHTDAGRHIFRPRVVEARQGRDNPAGTLLRRREGTYGPLGELQSLTATLIGGRDPDTGAAYDGRRNPTWNYSYDEYGNLSRYFDPRGYILAYEYDNEVRTYRISTRDSFGYVSQVQPNLRFGVADETIDINNQKTLLLYDLFGRLERALGPYELPDRTRPAVAVAYSIPGARPALGSPAHALITHRKQRRAPRVGETRADVELLVRTAMFSDGLGRNLQTKKDVERTDPATGAAVVGMTVSGRLTFDARGRLQEQGQPIFDSGPAQSFVAQAVPLRPTRLEYDVLSRVRKVTEPDDSSAGRVTLTRHGAGVIDGRTRLLTEMTDPNGRTRKMFRSVRDELLAVEERNTLNGSLTTLTTRYRYNPLTELVLVRDAKGNETRAEYDTLGQNIAIDNKDAGRTEFRYDLSGNLGYKQTAELRAKNKAIRYLYRFNRLEKIDYPFSKDVTYSYGESGALFNQAGRISRVSDESGTEDRFYGSLGELVRTVRTLADDKPKSTLYTTLYDFDSFGQLTRLTYPDGEVLSYEFDAGGRIRSATGEKLDSRGVPRITPYVTQIGYDEFQARVLIKYGNDAVTRYLYQPDSRRLSEVNSDSPLRNAGGAVIGSQPFQRLRYDYDQVGNVVALRNELPVPASNARTDLLGPVAQTYEYDDLYQLTTASGRHQPKDGRERRYTLSVAYDEISNVTRKTQKDVAIEVQGTRTTTRELADTSRAWSYEYKGPRPHAPTRVGDLRMSYDANGNRTKSEGDRKEPDRKLEWNEENRLREVEEDKHELAKFLYDADGVRTHKVHGNTRTLYTNQYFTVRLDNTDRRDRTKHIFVGDTRVVSRTGDGSQPTYFFFHSDHLLSTEFTSDSAGVLLGREEYFPYGETWVSNGDDPLQIKYRFNAKEIDQETGFYYYGARYYEPRVSQWINPDPLLATYLQGEVNAGVYLPANLGLYSYSFNNPVRLHDPDGQAVNLAAAGVGAAAGAIGGAGAYLFRSWRTGNFSVRGLAASTAGGAVTGGVAGLTMGASLLVQAGVAAGGAAAGGIVARGIETGSAKEAFDPKAMATDALVGGATFGVLKGASSAATRVLATDTGVQLQAIAKGVLQKLGPGRGPRYGTKAHTAFEQEIKALGRSDLTPEVSYFQGKVTWRGRPGSIRADVVEGPVDAPKAIFDLKTGGAKLTPERIKEIQSHLPPGHQNIPVLEVRGDLP